MELDEKVKKSIEEALHLKGQSKSYEKTFITLIKNFIAGNYTDDDIRDIIESIRINDEEKD